MQNQARGPTPVGPERQGSCGENGRHQGFQEMSYRMRWQDPGGQGPAAPALLIHPTPQNPCPTSASTLPVLLVPFPAPCPSSPNASPSGAHLSLMGSVHCPLAFPCSRSEPSAASARPSAARVGSADPAVVRRERCGARRHLLGPVPRSVCHGGHHRGHRRYCSP